MLVGVFLLEMIDVCMYRVEGVVDEIQMGFVGLLLEDDVVNLHHECIVGGFDVLYFHRVPKAQKCGG